MAIGLIGAPWLMFAGVLLLAMATGYASVAPMVLAADVVAPGVQGRAVGLLRVATDLSLMVSPIVAGVMSDHLGLREAIVITGVAVVVAAVITLPMLPETRPDVPRPPS